MNRRLNAFAKSIGRRQPAHSAESLPFTTAWSMQVCSILIIPNKDIYEDVSKKLLDIVISLNLLYSSQLMID